MMPRIDTVFHIFAPELEPTWLATIPLIAAIVGKRFGVHYPGFPVRPGSALPPNRWLFGAHLGGP